MLGKCHQNNFVGNKNYITWFTFKEINDASDHLVKDHITRFQDRVCHAQKQSLVAVPVYEINYTIKQVKGVHW